MGKSLEEINAAEPAYQLRWDEKANCLQIKAARELPSGTQKPTGQMLLDNELVPQLPLNGEIDDVTIAQVTSDGTSEDVAIAQIHKQAMLILCGQESTALLEEKRRLSLTAYLITGGRTAADAIASLLHTIEPIREDADDDDAIYLIPINPALATGGGLDLSSPPFKLAWSDKCGGCWRLLAARSVPKGGHMPTGELLYRAGMVKRQSLNGWIPDVTVVEDLHGAGDIAKSKLHLQVC